MSLNLLGEALVLGVSIHPHCNDSVIGLELRQCLIFIDANALKFLERLIITRPDLKLISMLCKY